MKILFLDFDGVLNCNRDRFEAKYYGHDRNNLKTGRVLNRGCVSLLEKILVDTGAKIVFSTNWRRAYSDDELYAFLVEEGFRLDRGVIIGRTPQIFFRSQKGREIASYLDDCEHDVTRFMILEDDNEYMSRYVSLNFDDFDQNIDDVDWIKTDPEAGLTEREMYFILNALGRTEEAKAAHDDEMERLRSLIRCIV